ncbi:MAG: hypothetical protein ACREBR_02775, partial [bacterium]
SQDSLPRWKKKTGTQKMVKWHKKQRTTSRMLQMRYDRYHREYLSPDMAHCELAPHHYRIIGREVKLVLQCQSQ